MSGSGLNLLFRELRRRKVFRVVAVYAVVAFIVVQVANNFFPVLQLPPWTQTFVAALALMGLPLAVVLAWAFELTPDGVRRAEPPDPARPDSSPPSPYRLLTAGVGAGILIGLVSFGGLAYFGGRDADPEDADSVSSPEEAGVSVAVLAFDDLSPAGDQAWFADGIAEEILTELTRVEGLRVTNRQSSFAFRGTTIDPRRIGDTLGVANLLTGSVRTGGDSVWVTPQLIDAGTGFQLWSETYARVPTAQNLRAIQSDVAREVASALALRFRPGSVEEADAPDDATYEAYLQARSYLRRWQTGMARDRDELLEALELFREVVSRSPQWAPGWAALGEAGHWAASGGVEPETHWPESKAALERALELDPDHPRANASLGFVLAFGDRDYEAAEAQYQRAFELEQDLPWHGYALLLYQTGRHEEASEAFRRAEARDPLSLVIKEQLVRSYVCARRFDEAVTRGRQTLALGRESPLLARNLAMALERIGQHQEARALLESGRAEGGLLPHPEWVLLSTRLGRIDEVEKALMEIEQTGAGDLPWAAPGLAAIYAALDRRDAALEALERGLREPHQLLAQLGCYPELDSLHGDPRHERILDLIQVPGR